MANAITTWTQIPNNTVVGDWTVSAIGAGQPLQSPITGTSTTASGTIGLTTGGVQYTNVPTNYLWDCTSMEITAPIDANGTYPDCEVFLEIDGVKTDSIAVYDASYNGNMLPRQDLTVGMKKLVFGESLRSLLFKALMGQDASNMAIRATGWKAASSVTIFVKSVAGFGNAGAPLVPLRVVLYADVMQDSDLGFIQNYWNGNVALNIPGYTPYSVVHSPTMPLGPKTWKTLPGGTGQNAVKIYKRINYAYNNQATVSGVTYRLTQKNELSGATANVIDSNHDLGDAFAGENSVFLWQEFGVRTAGAIYFGWYLGNTEIPNEASLTGTLITPGANKFQYGSVAPQLSDASRYFSVSDVSTLFRPFASGINVVPFINTGSLATVAANTVSVVKSGLLIQQS